MIELETEETKTRGERFEGEMGCTNGDPSGEISHQSQEGSVR